MSIIQFLRDRTERCKAQYVRGTIEIEDLEDWVARALVAEERGFAKEWKR